MQIPPYFLSQPTVSWDADTIASFDHLFMETVKPGTGAAIDYTLPAPKWQFLCYLSRHRNILLHGSGKADITEFEPRKANDVAEFGNRQAVYAASDGIWAMYFAIVDRENYVTSLVNMCCRIVEDSGTTDPYYFFSINGDALPHNPWRNGTIYLLPCEGFEQQARQPYHGVEIEHAQWASLTPVRPLANYPFALKIFRF